MTADHPLGKLDSAEAIVRHLDALVGRDPRLAPIRALAGEVPPRNTQSGFAGLARIVCGQQLSVASASAIWTRLSALPGALDPASLLRLNEPDLRAIGLSAGKVLTLRAVAEAIAESRLDFVELEAMPAEAAIATLTELRGIGPWSAELYLLFCTAHPDVFPAGDLALQKAAARGLGLGERLGTRDLAILAADWAPHRGAAALLFWRYFAALNRRDGVLI